MDSGNNTDNEVSTVISTEYGIDSIIDLSCPSQGGYLIETRCQVYWLKPMSLKSRMKWIYYEDAFTRHLKLHNFPARCLVRTLQGKLVISISDMQYVLTEYQVCDL